MTHIHSSYHWLDNLCARCPDLVDNRNQVVVASPCPPNGLLVIGEAPGCDEDCKGEGFVGAAGKTLDRLLSENDLERTNYGRANVCRCRPPNNRKPTTQEVKECLPFLANLILEVRPKVILAVGVTPTNILCGSAGTLYSKIQTRQTSGNWHASQNLNLANEGIRGAIEAVHYIVPMPHTSPLALNRKVDPKDSSSEHWENIAKRQVALAVELLRN